MKHIFLFFMALFFFAGASARTWNVEKITPPSWWAGMNHPELQINPEKPDVPINKNDAFQKVQKRRVQEKR